MTTLTTFRLFFLFVFASLYYETSSHGRLLGYLESSGTKVTVIGAIVCQSHEQRNREEKIYHEDIFFCSARAEEPGAQDRLTQPHPKHAMNGEVDW